ncbi:MAG: NADH-quinone oxidoreductase subunit F, partial [Candidatus Cloacimonetes bacterium]|nr:NADH-quinone oxidoreductase subunit F [Candidatus Cloacimonadota bacterium]
MKLMVGLGTCGISAGGEAVYKAFQKEVENLPVELTETGCMGMCYNEVLVELRNNDKSWLYKQVTPDMVKRIVEEHINNNQPVKEWLTDNFNSEADTPYFTMQKRIVLRNCGVIDPGSIDQYVEREGYTALRKSLEETTRDEIIETMKASGLR